MGLKGNLATVNLADVFQVLSRGNSSGLLRVQAPEGTRFVEIQNGVISIAGRSAGRIILGDLLLSRGLLDEVKLERALQVQRESGALLGQILIDKGMVALPQLEDALRFQIEEEVCELFTLKEGDFDFVANATLDAKLAPGGGFVRSKIDPNNLLLEAARRADEWKNVEQQIPSQSLVFDLTEEGARALDAGEGVSLEGCILLRLVKARRTVEGMVLKACLGRLTTNQMLLELVAAGLIEPAPYSSYESIAREHMRMKRLEEAERVARAAAEFGAPADQEKARMVLFELEKAPKPGSAAPGAIEMKIRTEVIRRPAPNLILKKERSSWPVVLVILAILAGVGGWVYVQFFMGKDAKLESLDASRKSYEEVMLKVNDLMAADKYEGALKLLQDFKSIDPTVNKRVSESFKNVQTTIESRLKDAMSQLKRAILAGTPEDVEKADAQFERFNGISLSDSGLEAERQKVREALKLYRETHPKGS